MSADLTARVEALLDAATHSVAAVLTEEVFGECDGTLAVRSALATWVRAR